MIAELDAVNLYEQMANLTKNEEIRTILLDIAREEKIHVAMFETVLLQADKRVFKDLCGLCTCQKIKEEYFPVFVVNWYP